MSGSVWVGGPGNVLTSKLVKEIALTDMLSAILVQTGVGYFRVYQPFRVNTFIISLFNVSTAGIVTVDINVNTVSILTTKLTIDINEKDSTTAAVPYALTGSANFYDFAAGQEVSFDVDVTGTGCKGLVAYMIGFDL